MKSAANSLGGGLRHGRQVLMNTVQMSHDLHSGIHDFVASISVPDSIPQTHQSCVVAFASAGLLAGDDSFCC
jgi:hypothetical protein